MTLSTSNVGLSWGPVQAVADARWTMAYAAGVGDDDPAYYATDLGAVPAHPLFSVSAEWSLLIDQIAASGAWSGEDALRGVHATHDLLLHQPLLSGTSFSLTADVVGVELRKPGAYQVIRHRAVTADGAPLWTSWTGSLFRGVGISGDPLSPDVPEAPVVDGDVVESCELPVLLHDAHVYTECARIWNPIHTDAAVAAQAGLPGLILHGTATLAKTVSALCHSLDTDPSAVRRVRVRFGAPARPGQVLSIRRRASDDPSLVPFDVVDPKGSAVLREGLLERRP